MSVRAVLFDLGGTLLHYVEPYASFLDANVAGLTAMHGYLQRAGYAVPSVEAFVGSVGQFARETNRSLEAAGRGGCVDDTFWSLRPATGPARCGAITARFSVSCTPSRVTYVRF